MSTIKNGKREKEKEIRDKNIKKQRQTEIKIDKKE
jgi:hypothetical protein